MTIISTSNLTKSYGSGDTAVTALRGINVRLDEGEFVAVMGPSGCGKSTLLHLIGGLDRPTSGDVTLAGQSIAALDDDALTAVRRRQIGFIFQFYNLLPVLNATENAALPLILDGMKPAEARSRALREVGGPGVSV
jgi:putative ABC transport system ATP-binding protein